MAAKRPTKARSRAAGEHALLSTPRGPALVTRAAFGAALAVLGCGRSGRDHVPPMPAPMPVPVETQSNGTSVPPSGTASTGSDGAASGPLAVDGAIDAGGPDAASAPTGSVKTESAPPPVRPPPPMTLQAPHPKPPMHRQPHPPVQPPHAPPDDGFR
jgi:hypothetical protein